MDSRSFRDALGNFATGVVIVAGVAEDGRPIGVTVNSFAAVSLAPPLVLFSLDRERNSTRHFAVGRPFAVNILSEAQLGLSRQFAALDGDRWAGVKYSAGPNGCALIDGVLASLEGRVEAHHDGGDHIVMLGRVERFHRAREGRPLVFFRAGYHALNDD